MSSVSDNKRIAKNTLLLYVRMFFTMAISIYTSRVVLNALGVTDYGINNVVGGVIVMLNFITGSLSGASSRFLTYDIGSDDLKKATLTFGNILTIHMLMAVFVVLVGETLGLWFVCNKLVIPEERMFAAHVVYQMSILSSALSIISVPYNSAIIAHEKMNVFAFIGISDVMFKLLIAYLLTISSFDRLILLSLLTFGVFVLDRIIYGYYCNRKFEETHTKPLFDKKRFKEMMSFAGWVMNGNLAVIGYTEGLNMLLNIYFGPIVNAARGIAVQVQSAVYSFCGNFQVAINPQLTKSYAKRDFQRMYELLVMGSKFSFYLLLFISLPVIFEADLILKCWLGIVPDHTTNFLRVILAISLLRTLSYPIVVSVNATGKLKKFQLVEGTLLLSILPLAYISVEFFNAIPEVVFLVHFIVEIITQVARVIIVLPMIHVSYKIYFKDIVMPLIVVLLGTLVLPMAVMALWGRDAGLIRFFIICISCVLSTVFFVYMLGCTSAERHFLNSKCAQVYAKIVKNSSKYY